jgi:hypothetical protein
MPVIVPVLVELERILLRLDFLLQKMTILPGQKSIFTPTQESAMMPRVWTESLGWLKPSSLCHRALFEISPRF